MSATTTSLKQFFYTQTPRLIIAEIKSAKAMELKGWFETGNGIIFDSVETIGTITKVAASEDKNYFIMNDMKEESIMVSASGEFTDDFIKQQVTRAQTNSTVIVRGKANVYNKDGQDRYSIRPKEIIAITSNQIEFRNWWYLTVVKDRIENNIPILKTSDLFSLIDAMKLKCRNVDDEKVLIDATIVKVAPRQVIVKETEKEDKMAPAASPVEPTVEKKKVVSKKVTNVDPAEKENIKKKIFEFVKKSDNPSLDSIRSEMIEGQNVDEKILESVFVDLLSKRSIKIDSNDKVTLTNRA